jgi:D-alanyl-D-alanine dipeptidase
LIVIALYSKKNGEIVSNPKYVATQPKVPYTIEGAVDITLVDANNRELDMGTPFDFLGRGQHGYDKLQMKTNGSY